MVAACDVRRPRKVNMPCPAQPVPLDDARSRSFDARACGFSKPTAAFPRMPACPRRRSGVQPLDWSDPAAMRFAPGETVRPLETGSFGPIRPTISTLFPSAGSPWYAPFEPLNRSQRRARGFVSAPTVGILYQSRLRFFVAHPTGTVVRPSDLDAENSREIDGCWVITKTS